MFSAITMDKRQLLVLCIATGLVIFQGSTSVGVLPVYAVQMGADSAATGLLLAVGFFAVMTGNIIGGWLSDRVGHRKLILLISLALWIPAALLMTQATNVSQLTLLLGLKWIPGGVANAMIVTITGLSAAEKERGRVFGLAAMAGSIGGLLTGVVSGPLAARWGFPALFVVMAALVAVNLVVAIFVKDPTVEPKAAPSVTTSSVPVGRLFYLIVIANMLARLGAFTSDLGRPLAMTELQFDAAAVSSAIAVSSAVTLPLPLILGWLSDRLGRKRFLTISYAVGAVGVLLLIPASSLWQFWLSATLVSAIISTNGVAQAYIADLVPPQAMGRSISLLITTSFLAGILGLSGGGYVMEALGRNTTLFLGASLVVCGIGLLQVLRQPVPNPEAALP